jgi:hypothetical protein
MICQAAQTPLPISNPAVAHRFSQTLLDLLTLSLELQDHNEVAAERDLYAK